MLFSLIAATVLVALADDPAALVGRLGAPRFADREAAATALEKLGADALTALRAAADDRDPEVRSRAAGIARKIEAGLLIEPTRVALDFRDRPLDEVAAKIGERAGLQIVLTPDGHPAWSQVRTTVVADEPLPLWEAIDRLCKSAGLAPQSMPIGAMMGGGPGAPNRPIVRLVVGPDRGFASNHGPFRAEIMSIDHHRTMTFNVLGMIGQPRAVDGKLVAAPEGRPDGGGPAVNRQFYLTLQVQSEPRLLIAQNGALKLTEAVDDRGQSMMPPSIDGQTTITGAYFGMNGGSSFLQTQAHLSLPDKPGRSIRLLRGSVPVTVMSPRPEPISLNLKDPEAIGKPIRTDDGTITLKSVRDDPNAQRTTIELVFRPTAAAGEPDDPFARAPGFAQIGRMPLAMQQQLGAVDAEGNPFQVIVNQSHAQADEIRLTITLLPAGPNAGRPVVLRYQNLNRAPADIPFEFRDVPIP